LAPADTRFRIYKGASFEIGGMVQLAIEGLGGRGEITANRNRRSI